MIPAIKWIVVLILNSPPILMKVNLAHVIRASCTFSQLKPCLSRRHRRTTTQMVTLVDRNDYAVNGCQSSVETECIINDTEEKYPGHGLRFDLHARSHTFTLSSGGGSSLADWVPTQKSGDWLCLDVAPPLCQPSHFIADGHAGISTWERLTAFG